MAIEHDTSILIVDHHRKGQSTAPSIDDLLGSTAKGAVADAVLQLYREQGKHDTLLQLTGRDIEEERELVVNWDGNLSCWQLAGDVDQIRHGQLRQAIEAAIDALDAGGQLATNTRIAGRVGRDKAQVSRTLGDLVAAGRVIKAPKKGKEQPYLLSGMKHNGDNGQPSLLTIDTVDGDMGRDHSPTGTLSTGVCND
jgi:hypothetical protein